MEITIKTIRGIAVTNLIILGLAGCSTSPAPWTQADDDPWGSKRASETESLPSDDAVSDTLLNDPVLLADPEPEPIMMQEPEMAPAPEVIVPVMVESAGDDIMSLPGTNYAIQVYASKTEASIDKFKANKGLDGLMTVKTDRSGSIVYVLVDIYPDRASANAEAPNLEAKTGSKPWVRSVAGLQKIVAP